MTDPEPNYPDWKLDRLVLGAALFVASPMVAGFHEFLFLSQEAEVRVMALGHAGSILVAVAAILLVGWTLLMMENSRRVVLRYLRRPDVEPDPDLVSWMRRRRIISFGVPVLGFLIGASLNKLRENGTNDFISASIGVLSAFMILLVLDGRRWINRP